jgi:aryl-alcohol dehydrogenase-like predicted oxidoreductase
MGSVELGLGLLSIGRRWGVNEVQPPAEEAALSLIGTAHANGVRFYDTAPAYASSEAVLGRALSSSILPRNQVTVATKMGEHWDSEKSASRPGHSFDELARSLDRSMELLGKIDLLQLHKATAANVVSTDVLKAIDRAECMGIERFGVSVSDLETAVIACKSGRYRYLQFPFNQNSRSLEAVFGLLAEHCMQAIVNRPFAMGALAGNDTGQSLKGLFRFIIDVGFSGIILTGTSSASHLMSNIAAFRAAVSRSG